MPHPDYPIETDRLTLRPLVAADLDDVHAYFSQPEVARYLYWEPRDREETRRAIQDRTEHTALAKEGDRVGLVVVWREIGRVVGDVNLVWRSEEHQQGELGFIFNPEFHGRGFATEAATEMLRIGFDNYGLHRIYGRCDARNGPSAALMERLGMRREAHLIGNEWFKGEWGDEYVYAMLDHEWRARSQINPH